MLPIICTDTKRPRRFLTIPSHGIITHSYNITDLFYYQISPSEKIPRGSHTHEDLEEADFVEILDWLERVYDDTKEQKADQA
jgi:hypothetical protein